MQIFCTESMHSDVVMMSVLMRLVILVCCAWSVKYFHSELESWSPDDHDTLHSMLLTSYERRLVITGQYDVYNVNAVKFKLLWKYRLGRFSSILIRERTETSDYVTVCSDHVCITLDPLDNYGKGSVQSRHPITIDGVAAFMATNTKWAERNKDEIFLFVGCPHVQGQEKLFGRCTEPGISWYLNSGGTKSYPWYGFKSYKDTPVLTDKYIDAFSVNKYRVFFSLQRVVTTGTKRSRIAQVCQNNNQKDGKDSTPYTYADMPIQCGQLREIRAVKKVVFQTETTFVAVFSESSKSAVCVFTMNNITEMFAENIKDCYRGIRIPKNEDYADYQDSDIPCSQAIADNDTFEKSDDYFLCNEGNLPVYRQVIGKNTLSSKPVVEYDDAQLTAVAVSVIDSKIIASFGTANGAVLQAVIYPNASAVKIWQPSVHNFGRDILHDMYSSDDMHLYVLTRKQLDTNTEAESPYSSQECSKFQLENGHVKGNMYEVGSKLEIECDADYQEATNMYQITCLPNGSWSHDPICEKAIVCSNPPEIENSVLSHGGTTLNSKRTYTCEEGYSTGNETVTMVTSCNDQGQWTSTNFTCYKDCGEPEKKDNAHVLPVSTHEGSVRKYECDTGFDVKNESDESYMSTQCYSHGWSWSHFECVVDCGKIPNITNTVVHYTTRTVLGSSVYYYCREGYELVGAFHKEYVRIECLENGTWSYTNNWSCEKKRTIGEECGSTDCMETGAVCVKASHESTCFCDSLSKYNETRRDCVKVCDSLTEDFIEVPSSNQYWRFMEIKLSASGEPECKDLCGLDDICVAYMLWHNHYCYHSQVTYDMIQDAFPEQGVLEDSITYSRRCM
ncbi:uncharacterized protein LOC123559140 isoform X2 [Mercenaria mercenaria]|uniref:uncharacterized protein LOC123559140 isoform X2 n=1 Tax=Mercenaria mercenaria TaxID=6596 RepID=UPI00234F7681|nr:uncharacterized protein LOC123559140 isoform X2 [Mercenaria mercenaria]